MMPKTWFKIFVWFMSIFFFFIASAIVISFFKPGPSEAEVMKFMEGMMSAMDSSLMGLSMNLENNKALSSKILFSTQLVIPFMIIGGLAGIALRIFRRR